MPITDFFVTTMTIVTAGHVEDAYGDLQPDWDNPSTVDTNGWIHETPGTETLGNRDTIVGHAKIFLPHDTIISGLDRVIVGPVTYNVAGAPRVSRTRLGPHHLEVDLEAVEQEPDS